MHDLVAAQDIIKAVIQVAKRNKLKKISKIVVGLGKVVEHNEEIKPENLQFNFELVKKNTIADKAKLIIQKGKGRDLTILEVEGEK
jgi:Zn finger protein HypA/HybF involved in hydrogenase expression